MQYPEAKKLRFAEAGSGRFALQRAPPFELLPVPKPHAQLAEIARQMLILPAVAPAAVVAVAWRQGASFTHALGAAFQRQEPMWDEHVFFDLASVSKSFVACTVARLVRAGRLDFETKLSALLPEARPFATGSATILQLLSHRAGLEAHRALFAPLLAGLPMDRALALSEVLRAVRPECARPASADGHPPLYSDLGFALVGWALERLEGLPLEAIVRREVGSPLGLEVGSGRQLRAGHPHFAARCMPTETVPFRGGQLLGVVHDENAWALSGHGLSGHAGLFGTATDVMRFGVALLDAESGRDTRWLNREQLVPLLAARPGGTLRAGFDGKSADQSSAGQLAGPRSFGHLGFTGTSLWCDPDAQRVLVLLSNRVCPTRNNARIRAARPAVNDALFRFSG